MSETHDHYWQLDDEETHYACTECAETCEVCIRCRYWTGNSLVICDRCVTWVKRRLDDIETAVSLYSPMPPSPIRPTRYDRDRITGSRSDQESMRWRLGDVLDACVGWADLWAEAQGKERTIGAMDYLRGHIWWAAHNRADSDWDQWLSEMGKALYAAKGEAGLLPKRMAAPCVHCGGVAVRTWAHHLEPHDDGLSDEVTCLGCGLSWTSEAQFRQVAKTHLQVLPEFRPDALVTLDEAATVWPDVPVKTWRTWLNRGEIPDAVAWDVRGRPQYRVGDLAFLPERRADETRRGRRAG